MYDGSEEPRRRSRRRGETEDKRVSGILELLRDEAEKRVKLRENTESRWIEDITQYFGQYDTGTNSRLNKEQVQRSRLFINLTRPKTNALAARLMDLLFPTDDRSWGIQPSPVPEMDVQEGALNEEKRKLGEVMQGQEVLSGVQDVANDIQKAIDDLQELRNEAGRRAELMQAEIDDQLKATSYQAQCRDAIEDACKLGTGILKGPVLTGRAKRRWMNGDRGYGLQDVAEDRPGYVRVDPWSFFPDPNARPGDTREGDYERHLMSKKDLRNLARRPDMDQDAIRNLLKSDPSDMAPQGLSQLYTITNDEQHQVKGKYQVWEYTGPIEPEDMHLLADVYEDSAIMQEMQDIDPLTEIHAKVWFCETEVLSFALHPLESNEEIYSIFNVERSETGVFGYGVPWIIRDPQSAMNAAWRMMMDNARISAGPQVVINEDRIKPANNGGYTLDGMKLWLAKEGNTNAPAFEVYNIVQNQDQLAAIIEMARRDVDEMSSMPAIAQGEQGAGITKTAQGMALLMNSANVVFRRMVKNWDDDMTVPNIRRMYDFNMQFSPKEAIKGDYEVDARGSSVLLVREIQSTNLMNIAAQFADHPEYGVYINKPELLRAIMKANMVPTTGIVRSEAEAEAERQKMQGQGNPEAELMQAEMQLRKDELEAKVEIANMEADSRIKVAKLNYDAAMERFAHDLNERGEDRELKRRHGELSYGDKAEAARIAAESKERGLAAEIAMRRETGKSSGGAV